ncbi:MAG: Ig-like domain-containing protein, partial [Clostridia bacterium]|nr:Ig-like domain-containing protein [Clostridia bacterium]
MKSIAQRLMAVISAVVLTVTLLIPAFQASAASVKLNKTKIVLAVGQTYALKLSGTKKTVKWATSNKKVATVTKKGVVKAVGKGKAVITAKVGKKTYKCAVGVDAPKLSATKKTV